MDLTNSNQPNLTPAAPVQQMQPSPSNTPSVVGAPGQPPPVVAQPTPTVPVQQQPGFRDFIAQKMGVQIPVDMPDAALYEQVAQSLAESERLRSDPSYQAFIAQQQQRVAPPAANPQDDRPLILRRPEWNAEWSNFVSKDESTGFYRPVAGAPPEYAQRANEYVQWVSKVQSSIFDNPTETFWSAIQPKLEEFLGGRQQAAVTMNEAQRINQGNADWAFSRDQTGNVMTGLDGRPVFTDGYKEYLQIVNILHQKGLQDVNMQDTIAKSMMKVKPWEKPAQPPQAQPAAHPASPADASARNMAWQIQNAGATRSQQILPGQTVSGQQTTLRGLTFREKMLRQKGTILR